MLNRWQANVWTDGDKDQQCIIASPEDSLLTHWILGDFNGIFDKKFLALKLAIDDCIRLVFVRHEGM